MTGSTRRRSSLELLAVIVILAVYLGVNAALLLARPVMMRSARAAVDSLLVQDRNRLDADLLRWRQRMFDDGRWVADLLNAVGDTRSPVPGTGFDSLAIARVTALTRGQMPGARLWVFDSGGTMLAASPSDTATARHRWLAETSMHRDTATLAAVEARGLDLRLAVATPIHLNGRGMAAVVLDLPGVERLRVSAPQLGDQAHGGQAAVTFPYENGFVGVTWAANGGDPQIGWPNTGWSLKDPALIVVGGALPDTTHFELAIPRTAAQSLVETRLAWMHAAAAVVALALCLSVLLVGRARRNTRLVSAEKSLAASQLRAAQAEAAATRAGLAQISARLNPHFLSNALHSVSALISADPAAAEEAIDRLGDLFRYSVEHSERHFVLLEEEWRFVKDYLSIEQMRLGARLTVVMDLEPEAAECEVPTFVLQPLVENAVRHGISPLSSGGTIRVSARRVNQGLELLVSDNGVGVEMTKVEQASGTGLRTLKQRLALDPRLAGEVDVTTAPAAGFTVRVRLLNCNGAAPTGELFSQENGTSAPLSYR